MARMDHLPYFRRLLENQGVWQAKKDELRCVCPLHAGARNRSSFMAMRDGRWRCFACGAGGKIEDLVVKLLGVNFKQAQELVGTPPAVFVRINEIARLPPFAERRGGGKQKTLSEAEIAPYRRYCPNYLLDRGFSEAVLRRYEVGYDVQNCRIVIPARNVEGRLIGLTYRKDFDCDESSKYMHEHWDKSKHLYGLDKVVKQRHRRVFLVEGQLDTMRLNQLGLAACAIMGSALSLIQKEVLVRCLDADKLVLAFDNDEAGKHATKRAITLLCRSRFGPNLYVAHYSGKDPGDLTEHDEIRAVPWAKEIMPEKRPRPLLRPALVL